MADSNSPRGFGAAARVTALAASVMDLHVRIALQEVDREKRRLISGGLFLAIGGTAMFLALLAAEASLLLWIQAQWELDWMRALLTLSVANSGDRPIQVGSHFHFIETNPYLKFDRAASYGKHHGTPRVRSCCRNSTLHSHNIVSTAVT